jgi:hypothetical protein
MRHTQSKGVARQCSPPKNIPKIYAAVANTSKCISSSSSYNTVYKYTLASGAAEETAAAVPLTLEPLPPPPPFSPGERKCHHNLCQTLLIHDRVNKSNLISTTPSLRNYFQTIHVVWGCFHQSRFEGVFSNNLVACLGFHHINLRSYFQTILLGFFMPH